MHHRQPIKSLKRLRVTKGEGNQNLDWQKESIGEIPIIDVVYHLPLDGSDVPV
jgi:hypothetical protein